MSKHIASLIARKAITADTELQVLYQHKTYRVLVCDIEDKVLVCRSIVDGMEMRVKPKDIQLVDGMQVSRIIKMYDIDDDGNLKTPPKKRGRKPKVRS